MKAQELVGELNATEQFFNRSTDVLTEEDSQFKPAEGTWTIAHQVAHVAQTVDWFVEGCSRAEGFDMDFEKHGKAISSVQSLEAARKWVAEAFEAARKFYGSKTDEELSRKLPDGPVMGGAPISHCVSAITDHSAHHRGALTVYSRLLGKIPSMPYM